MLTEQALASDWVKKEATILLWRHALGSRIVVIPLLIGVTEPGVEAAFPAIEIFERQYLQITDAARSRDGDQRRSLQNSAGRRTRKTGSAPGPDG